MDKKKVREAIEIIKSNYPTSGYYMLREGLDTAISALEKQLAKKPIFQHMIGEIKEKFKRPCCNNLFTHECPTFPYEDMEHCSKCGQKLDWTE